MTYTTRALLHAAAVQSNPRLTYDQIPQEVVDLVNAKVRSLLAAAYITDDVSGHQDVGFLEASALCYGLEQLANQGKIRWTPGEMAGVQEGPFREIFANGLPSRWEATTQTQFDSMFSHETWRMMGGRFVAALIVSYGKRAAIAAPTLLHDDNMRGYGATDRYRW